MNEPRPEGFQPAPWEAGKPKPPQGYPPQPGASPAYPPRPAAPGYGAQPPAAPPPGAGFGGGDMGRGRTRQVPGPAPQAAPPVYGAPPAGYGAPQPAYPPQAQPYPPQGQPYPPQGQPYPQPAGAPIGQPYGAQPYPPQAMPAGKQTSVLAILSLVAIGVGMVAGLASLGLFSIPFFIAGGVLGYLGMRETAEWGKKTGRGMAVGGTIANTVLLVLNVGALLAVFLFAQATVSAVETNMNATFDGALIQERVRLYAEAKGDLKPGGPQFKQGFRNDTAVAGPQLQVTDLVTPAELKNPIEQYALTIADNTATVWWTGKDGQRMQVGQYPGYGGAYADDYDDRESYDPPPRRK
ncbi:MAG: DUF4190 domain-containing protein [Planctomycetota bacterium]|nr:DUF4190 domain-containing protein [Planctomycetota bacterium]